MGMPLTKRTEAADCLCETRNQSGLPRSGWGGRGDDEGIWMNLVGRIAVLKAFFSSFRGMEATDSSLPLGGRRGPRPAPQSRGAAVTTC